MTKVAIYARYSSDNQREASIEDQFRLCREYAKRQGWQLVESYSDQAISGASLLRPGIQTLLADAQSKRFNVIPAESLDRISRDQEDIAGVYKRMSGALAMPPISSPTTSPHQTDDQPSAGKGWRLAALPVPRLLPRRTLPGRSCCSRWSRSSRRSAGCGGSGTRRYGR
jgi:hypothetical protein